jgi:hypothetical protein
MSGTLLIIYIKPYPLASYKKTMFEYMRARNGNIIAVVDKKKNRRPVY